MRGRGHLNGFFVINADETALAALADIRLALVGVLLDVPPGKYWIF